MNPAVVFQAPHFSWGAIGFTALGASFFWARTGRTKLKIYVLSWMFDAFKVPDNAGRQVTEFALFIVFGCLVGIAIANPTTAVQAITAGFAWTGFVAKRA
jgi:hypothetical protein